MKRSFLSRATGYAGGFTRCGHRVVCADGRVRAVELAPHADTFFSVPAWMRHKGRRVSGYITQDTTQDTADGDVMFRPHTRHYEAHPELVWPTWSTALVVNGHTTTI